MTRTNPHLKIETQRDNINAWTGENEFHNQCMVESFTAMVQWVRAKMTLDNLPTLENYTAHTHYIVVGETKEKAQKVRFISGNHAAKLNFNFENYKHKIPYKFVNANLTLEGIKKIVTEKNSPVLVGSMLTHYGHILCYDGLWQDPYGSAEKQIRPGNAVYKNVNGSDCDYPDDFARSMIFRTMKQVKDSTKKTIWITDKINQPRPCWYLEKK